MSRIGEIPFIQEIADDFCDKYGEGWSWEKICAQPGYPTEQGLRWWLARYPSFQAQFILARERKADRLVDEAIQIADYDKGDVRTDEKGRVVVDWENVNRSKLKVETRKWAASRLAPLKWGDSVRVEGTVNVQHQMEASLNDRLLKLRGICDEFASRGGQVKQLLALVGLSPEQIEAQDTTKKRKKAKSVDAEFRDNTPEDNITDKPT